MMDAKCSLSGADKYLCWRNLLSSSKVWAFENSTLLFRFLGPPDMVLPVIPCDPPAVVESMESLQSPFIESPSKMSSSTPSEATDRLESESWSIESGEWIWWWLRWWLFPGSEVADELIPRRLFPLPFVWWWEWCWLIWCCRWWDLWSLAVEETGDMTCGSEDEWSPEEEGRVEEDEVEDVEGIPVELPSWWCPSCFGWWRIPRPEALWWWEWRWEGNKEELASDSKPKCDRAVYIAKIKHNAKYKGINFIEHKET